MNYLGKMRGYPQFSFWISMKLVKIYISCIIINRGKNTFELVGTALNRKQTRPFFMFQAHLLSYFGMRNCLVWKRFATMRSYDNMFHGFCSKRKCFQQRLISFRSVLIESDNTCSCHHGNKILNPVFQCTHVIANS